MPCYHPMPAIRKDDGTYKVFPVSTVPLSRIDSNTGEVIEPIKIPCGKCIGCRMDYSRHWADRCTMESMMYPEDMSWFITLTYDDEHIVPVMPENASRFDESPFRYTLYPDHVSAFLKRLRRFYEYHYEHVGIRYYYCGEYGSTTFRPHYHLIAFNLPLYDLVPYKTNFNGDVLYNSETLNDLWGHGFVVVGACTWQTSAYVARYVLKKQKGKGAKDYYKDFGIVPEFVRMSRDGGIGLGYYNRELDKIYEFDKCQLPNGVTCKPPKYFDDQLKKITDERFKIPMPDGSMIDVNGERYLQFLKEKRKEIAIARHEAELMGTDLDEVKYFEAKEDEFMDRVKSLKRLL